MGAFLKPGLGRAADRGMALQLCDCSDQVRKLLPIGVNFFETTSGACRVGQHEVFQTVIGIAADSVENLLAVAAENRLRDKFERDSRCQFSKMFGIKLMRNQIN
jgi:hypothetical protein